MTASRQALGARGEAMAARWYEDNGYEVIDRNWRTRDGELDLVVRRSRMVVFCEVKTRSSLAFGSPAEAVTRDKRQRIRLLAAKWLETAPFRPARIRFDVAAVLDGSLDIIEGAF